MMESDNQKPRVCFDLSSVALGCRVPSCRAGIYRYGLEVSERLLNRSEIDVVFSCFGATDSVQYLGKIFDQRPGYRDRYLGHFNPAHPVELAYRMQMSIDRTHFYKFSKHTTRLVSSIRNKRVFDFKMLDSVDIIHSPFDPFPDNVNGPARLLTIHDVIALTHPQYFSESIIIKMRGIIRQLRSSDWIMCDSFCTKQDLFSVAPHIDHSKVSVNHLGVNENFSGVGCFDLSSLIPDMESDAKYLLSVGTIEPRKNLKTLLDAFALIAETYPKLHLVLTGSPGWGTELSLSPVSHLLHRVHLLGRVDDELLIGLYRVQLHLHTFHSMKDLACRLWRRWRAVYQSWSATDHLCLKSSVRQDYWLILNRYRTLPRQSCIFSRMTDFG